MSVEDRIDSICRFVLENACNLHEPDVHAAFELALQNLLDQHFREVVREACWRRERDLEPSCN